METSPSSGLPSPGAQDPTPKSFVSVLVSILCPTSPHEIGLPFWMSGVLCQCSEDILWEFFYMQVFFDIFVGEKEFALPYSSAVLKVLLLLFLQI